ncbi:MAG: hypothetical protein Kow0047_21710 [Anaerolineae bacterium]
MADRRAVVRSSLLLVVALLIGGTTLACAQSEHRRPRLIVEDSVAADFEALAEETWGQFLEAFQTRADCFGDVRLRAAYTLHSRAAYDPARAVVTVRVPGTPAMLQSALVHEWAHHVEFQCAAHQALRPAFLTAQGLPPDTPWRPGGEGDELSSDAWADAPSEQYAEAVVVYVLGERPIPTKARVRREAVSVIRAWATAEDMGR